MRKLLSITLGFVFLLSAPLYSLTRISHKQCSKDARIDPLLCENCGLILIDESMSHQEQENMGISKLNDKERQALEQWLNKHFIQKPEQEKLLKKKDLYVSEIINNGQQLKLSDDSLYEIAPDDWARTQVWIGATAVEVSYSGDPYYPWTITNPLTGYSVSARLIDTGVPLKKETPSTQSKKGIIIEG